jgi:hypothetical protein
MEIRRVSIHSFIRGESGVASGEDWGPLRTVDLLIYCITGLFHFRRILGRRGELVGKMLRMFQNVVLPLI